MEIPPTTNTQVQNDRIAQPGNCSCLHGIAAGTSLSQSKSPNERCWASASQSWWPDASKVHRKGLQRRLWQQPQKGARTVTQHGPKCYPSNHLSSSAYLKQDGEKTRTWGLSTKPQTNPLIPPHKYCSSIQGPSPCLSANNAIDLPDEAQANLTVADALQVPKVWSSLDIHRANHGLEDRKPTEGGCLPKLVLGFQKMAADSNQKWTHVAQECQENMFLMAANCSVRSLVPKGPPTLPFPSPWHY